MYSPELIALSKFVISFFSVFFTANKHRLIPSRDCWIRVLIRGLFNYAVSSSDCTGVYLRVARWLAKSELERTRKEAIVV
jgi:primosomal replication protein N